jgi:hypothetical protein
MACTGTGRPLTATSVIELDMKRYGAITDTLEGVRRTRLLMNARLFELADRGMRLEMPEDQDAYDPFYEAIAELLSRFDVLQRIVVGLPGAFSRARRPHIQNSPAPRPRSVVRL